MFGAPHYTEIGPNVKENHPATARWFSLDNYEFSDYLFLFQRIEHIDLGS
jgi:hypothetical protein